MSHEIYKSLFENDFIKRSLRGSINKPDIVLTELVANAWDAGATEVHITLPNKIGRKLSVSDNGEGMTKEEFLNRWMVLRYNRTEHQGNKITLTSNNVFDRKTYGRNGVGRHGLFCFNDSYEVETAKDGTKVVFRISINKEDEPFIAEEISSEASKNHGTGLSVIVDNNLPNANEMCDVISSRFIFDPHFNIYINDRKLELSELKGLIKNKEIVYNYHSKKYVLKLYFIDTLESGRKSKYQGIAIWQDNRLVGKPSWRLGEINILDGRSAYAKRYTCVVVTSDLGEFVKEDWTGFTDSEILNGIYKQIADFIDEQLRGIAKDNIDSTKETIKKNFKKELNQASPLTRLEVDEAISNIIISSPKATIDAINLAVQAILNLGKSKDGQQLLAKIAKLDKSDIKGLNDLLSKWSVRDALTVLEEIDRRITIIEAIKKLSSDKSVDELHVLHPLITEARWLFGPEYESSEFIFNNQLKTVVAKLFGAEANHLKDVNYMKRPDLICLDNSTFSFTAVNSFNRETNTLEMSQILIIELKRGGFKLTRKERNQLQEYVEDILNSNKQVKINAYVVGDNIDDSLQRKTTIGDNNQAVIYVVKYSELVDTAEMRLFGLREKLSTRYDNVPGMELYRQTKLQFKNNK